MACSLLSALKADVCRHEPLFRQKKLGISLYDSLRRVQCLITGLASLQRSRNSKYVPFFTHAHFFVFVEKRPTVGLLHLKTGQKRSGCAHTIYTDVSEPLVWLGKLRLRTVYFVSGGPRGLEYSVVDSKQVCFQNTLLCFESPSFSKHLICFKTPFPLHLSKKC